MFKVVVVCDKKGTALDRLCQGVAKYHDNLDYVVCDVHPKRPDPEQLQRFEQEAMGADVIDFQYWKTAVMLKDLFPWLKDKKQILTHNNPYSVDESNWDDFDKVVANNETIRVKLKELMHNPAERLSHIPLTVDTDFWTYNADWTPNKNVIMVANRIESKKGILEVANACGNLGLNFILVGQISDRAYFNDILQSGAVDFHEQISDEDLKELYYQSTIHVCNSADNFESGTLPILESMLCGVPVLTRNVGHVPDLNNGENLTILETEKEDVVGIMKALEDMMNDKKKLESQRSSAWNTAKNFSNERRAFMYQRLYRSLVPGTPVSVVVPIYDKPDTIRACLNAIAEQDYPDLELIVCDDADTSENHLLVLDFAKTVSFPVRYIPTAENNYGLARARNEGICAATGEIVVFCDQRQIMEKNCVSELVANITPKSWVYGNKGGKREFVENLSAIHRTDIIHMGMFNERINLYGGLSQYCRSVAKANGVRTVFVESAKATPLGKSSNKFRKKAEIIKMKNLLFKLGL